MLSNTVKQDSHLCRVTSKAVATALALTGLIFSAFLHAADKPNFLVIIADDQSIDTISALGNDRITTPNLDKLVSQGTTFTHVFNQGSWSGAVCAPSRQMINTGRNLHFTGFQPKNGKSTKHPLWGETFRKNGYETFMTGKWHVGADALKRSFDLGRAVHEGGMPRLSKGGQWKPWLTEFGDGIEWTTEQKNQHTSVAFADAAVNYLNSKDSRNDKPFFMYVGFTAPHDPRQSPQEYVDRYPPESVLLPENYMDMHPFDDGDFNNRDEALMTFPRTKHQTKEFIAEYYAMIEHMDAEIGRIFDALEASGKADNTYVIFTADHGLAVGKHGLAGKQNSYEHSIRAPFILAGKNIPANNKVKGMFYLNSLFPTTAELAGISTPDTVQAESIVPLITGQKEVMYNTIYGSYRHFQRMARNQRYKMIYFPMLKKTVLFDLQSDPWEMNDISAQPGSAPIIAQLSKELESLKEMTGDPLTNDDPIGSYAPFMLRVDKKKQYDAIKARLQVKG